MLIALLKNIWWRKVTGGYLIHPTHRTQEMLLDILETEDSYIDVDTIIVKWKSNSLVLYFHFILFF